ncbi:DnaA initiator-associating protein [Quillaja saponaria]|uniref:DnaA initiator-associating protein n=1 Tax=Quillaja saponaria TaxID=32244 RepID=A0AAD7Q6H3_QUISA|nr:DnaA initiator-associating protein [Quillaja saponaria]
MSSGKNMSRSSRLIGAATKILEPGLQATSRAKCSLPYSRPIYSHKDDIVTEGSGAMSPDVMESTGYNASAAELLMGQTSCTSYGNLLDPVDCRPNVDEQPEFVPSITLNVVNASSLVSMQRKSMPHVPFHEERDKDSQRSQDQLISFVAQGTRKNNRQPRRKPLSHEGMAPWHLSSQPCWPHQKDESSPIAFKNRTQTQDQMLLGSDKILPRSKLSNLHTKRVSSAANAVGGTKDFVALNRSLSGRPRSRNATKIDNSMLDLERKSSHGQDNSLPEVRRVVRKRRTANISAHESTASISSTIVKERNIQCEALGGKKMSLSAPSTNHNSVKSKSGGQGEMDKVNENKVTDVISFTFNSPLKTKIGIPTDKEEKSMNKFSTHAQIPFPLTGDALGALLEQKLRELTCQEDEELAAGAPPKHCTALILQELISALTAEQSICLDRHNADMSFYNEVNNERLLGVSCDGNHFSPGSVLEASFSSSSLDESSGHVLHPDSMDFSCDHLQPLEPDVELSDSATSLNKGKRESMTDLANYIPRLLQIVNLSGDRYTRSKLTHTKDVILNATVQNLDGVHDLFIARFLLDELENIANAVWTYFKGIMGCDLLKKGSRLQGFLFDSVMEYLETKYCRYSNCGFSAWKKSPSMHES